MYVIQNMLSNIFPIIYILLYKHTLQCYTHEIGFMFKCFIQINKIFSEPKDMKNEK